MIDRGHRSGDPTAAKVPEARYAYYRRCQVFRKGGEQCKAPAEKGSHICYAHAGHLATAVRRERERRAVLAEAVGEMRRRGKTEYEMADLFMDFKGIQVTLAVMAQALIDGRIDCKTAGRLVVELQTMSKLLWIYHRGTQREKALTTKDTKEHEGLPQIYAEERRSSKREELPELFALPKSPGMNAERNWAANEREETRIALLGEVRRFADRRGWGHDPPELLSAA